MVQTCYICKWRADKLPRRSFHKFPYDEAERQKWLAVIGKSHISVGKRTSVCSMHFDSSCFRYGQVNGRELLRAGSVPSLQLTRPPEVDPYMELYKLHQEALDVKPEAERYDWVARIGDRAPSGDLDNHDSLTQNIKTENEELFESAPSLITVDVPITTSYTKSMNTENETYKNSPKSITVEVAKATNNTKIKAKNKQKNGRIIKMDITNRKEFLKKQALIRTLVERLRRDHVKLKNYIQSLEERKNTRKRRRKTVVEVSIEESSSEFI